MYKPNTILNRFDCLLFDVKHESWRGVRRKNFRDRCVTTQILVSETQVFENINDIVLSNITLHTRNFL